MAQNIVHKDMLESRYLSLLKTHLVLLLIKIMM